MASAGETLDGRGVVRVRNSEQLCLSRWARSGGCEDARQFLYLIRYVVVMEGSTGYFSYL